MFELGLEAELEGERGVQRMRKCLSGVKGKAQTALRF
jgi:hypothetical protein